MRIGQGLLTAGIRGAVGAMAMTGVRSLTTSLGLVDQTPPEALLQEKAGGLMAKIPADRQQVVTELTHWGIGLATGAGFALLPAKWRRHQWSGAAYGLTVMTGFEAGIAPLLGLSRAGQARPMERLLLVADHLLWGIVLSPPRHRHP